MLAFLKLRLCHHEFFSGIRILTEKCPVFSKGKLHINQQRIFKYSVEILIEFMIQPVIIFFQSLYCYQKRKRSGYHASTLICVIIKTLNSGNAFSPSVWKKLLASKRNEGFPNSVCTITFL